MEEYLEFMSATKWICLGYTLLFAALLAARRNSLMLPPKLRMSLLIIYALGLVAVMGLTPIPWDSHFDRDHYAVTFEWKRQYVNDVRTAIDLEGNELPDPFFQFYQYVLSRVMEYKAWLVITAAIYVGNYVWASVRFSKKHCLTMFLAFVCGFAFFSYGINAIRAGLGFSFVLVGISYYKKWLPMILCFLFGIAFHVTMALPVAVFLVTAPLLEKWKDKTIKISYIAWIAICIISLIFGHTIIDLFAGSIHYLPGTRFDYLGDGRIMEELGMSYNSGFRWDFVIFSMIPMIAALVYKVRFGYRSEVFDRILVTYIWANAVWLLSIRFPYTDRIAYLSWFLMPLLLFYPLIVGKIKLNPNIRKILVCGGLVCESLLFGFIM